MDITISAWFAGQLDAWIDWNADGDWDDAGELIAAPAPAGGTDELPVDLIRRGRYQPRIAFDDETLEELAVRVAAALDDLAEAAGTTDIVVVSHVSPIKAAVAWALGAP